VYLANPPPPSQKRETHACLRAKAKQYFSDDLKTYMRWGLKKPPLKIPPSKLDNSGRIMEKVITLILLPIPIKY